MLQYSRSRSWGSPAYSLLLHRSLPPQLSKPIGIYSETGSPPGIQTGGGIGLGRHADDWTSLREFEGRGSGCTDASDECPNSGFIVTSRGVGLASLLPVTGDIFHRVHYSPSCQREGPTRLVSRLTTVCLPISTNFRHMSALASDLDSKRRFAAQAVHRQSQSLQSNHTAHHQLPLPSDRPFLAHSHSQPLSNPMIGPTAPAAPYDPNVYPSYPPPERHQQDYENFIMTQLSAPTANSNPSGLSAPPPGNTIGRPPQAVYSDNTIERMVQRDPYVIPYPSASANPQAFLGGGGYAMQNQNLYTVASGPNYTNGIVSYPDPQAPGGIYTYGSNLSPDSIHSIESPSMMMQQGPIRSHTMPIYSSVNRVNGPPDAEVPFSQIVARNNSGSPQTQSIWPASGSPTNPNYGNTGHFPVARSNTAKNGAAMAVAHQHMQAVRATTENEIKILKCVTINVVQDVPQMQQHGLPQPQGLQSRPNQGNLAQPDRRTVPAPSGSPFVVTSSSSHIPPGYAYCPKDGRCNL